MKRLLLTITFDGTDYHGWQVQPNGITVQEVMNNSLNKLLGVKTDVTGCSRTDAGVHARKFFCHIDCDDSIPESAFLKGLNSILPNDISVIAVKRVPDDFHARYNALGKRYIYGMYTGVKNPFDERYFLHLDTLPDIRKMNAFAKTLNGTHDFYAFSASGRTVEDTVRTVSKCSVAKKGNKIYLSVSAGGFLYNMVRIIAGTALYVGYGKIDVNIAKVAFREKDRSVLGDTLKPHGLFLDEVFY